MFVSSFLKKAHVYLCSLQVSSSLRIPWEKRRFSSIGSDGSCAVPTSRKCRSCQEEWSSSQPRPAKPVPYGSAVRPVVTRSVSIHPDEALLCELRERQLTATGRAKLRERVAVEHALAHIGHWQGRRARYRGLRKNLFDLRRCAVVHNLHVIARVTALSNAA